jgi:sulfoquinovosidase
VSARFEERDGGFDLLLGDRVILRHRIDAPAFRIAKGNPTVTMVRGNFRMEDAPTDERVLRYMVAPHPLSYPRGLRRIVRKMRGLSDEMLKQADIAQSLNHNMVSLSDDASAMPLLTMFIRPDMHCLHIEVDDWDFDRIVVQWALHPEEIIWGGGEQMSHLVLNGRRFPMWTSEPGVGREPGTALTDLMNADGSFAGGDYWTTNYPEPTVISSRGYAIAQNADCYGESAGPYSEIDLSTPGVLQTRIWDRRAGFSLFEADSPAKIVGQLSNRKMRHPGFVSGFMAWPAGQADADREAGQWLPDHAQHDGERIGHIPLPDWAIGGAIVGLKDGANSFARLERIIEAGAAVSGLWCEDWCGIRQTSFGRRLFWDWQWNAARYPDLPARIAELKARGIRFLGYVNPYLAVDGPQYAEAARLGYLARRLDSDAPYAVDFGEFDAGVVDFTNEAAAQWFAGEIIGKQMLDIGIDGWMADFGEYLPVDLRLHRGDPMAEHNRWPVHWAKVNADAVASRGRTGDALFFMRAGYTGVQQYCPLLWAGDQSVDFSRHDGIGTVITAALSAGLVGNAFSHSDVGGYTSLHGNVRTEELMFRWYELGAFTPVMRTHEGNRPDDNLQIDSTPELLAGFVRWSRVHAALGPYVRHLCNEASAIGLPAQRALFLHWPDDRETFTIQDQYLYGADLMVAPVIEEGAVARRVYLPGTGSTVWRHLWSGADFTPGWHDIDAPIGSPPVFYRPDSAHAELFASLPSVRGSP